MNKTVLFPHFFSTGNAWAFSKERKKELRIQTEENKEEGKK